MSRDVIGRARRLLSSPATEWTAIDAEPADLSGITWGYVTPLVIFQALCGMIGALLFGVGLFATTPPILTIVLDAAVNIVVSIGMVYVFAFIIDALAPTFSAHRSFGQAFKVAAYSPTAAWLAGVFLLHPFMWPIYIIAALYSLYLLFTGLPRLMKPRPGQGVVYTIFAIVIAIGLSLVLQWLIAIIRPY
jgi:hypothetical protein